MKRTGLLLILTLLFLMPINVNALFCSSKERSDLKKIISNINVSYDYSITSNNAIFSIKFNNVSPELYMKDQYKHTYYFNNLNNNEFVLPNYSDGKSYRFDFYGVKICPNEKIGSLYATTPSCNPFYKLYVCDDAKEYELCQKWSSHSLSRSEFIEKVKQYKASKNLIDDTKTNKKISVIDFIMNFIRMYGLYVIIGIAIIIIIIKIIRYKKDSFGF